MTWQTIPLHDKPFALGDQSDSQWEVGDIKWSASTVTSKIGWLEANGQAVSRTQYKRLFDDVGTTYGVGDGSTTFNVPNIAGKTVVGLDSGDADFDTMGETQGAKTHQLTVAQMPQHNHNRNNDGLNELVFRDDAPAYILIAGSSMNLISGYYRTVTGYAGLNEAHPNIQPSITLRAWVKT